MGRLDPLVPNKENKIVFTLGTSGLYLNFEALHIHSNASNPKDGFCFGSFASSSLPVICVYCKYTVAVFHS